MTGNGLVHDLHDMVWRFNREVIGLPIPPAPTRLPAARKAWALMALREELEEYENANVERDEADALVDLTYFALGRLVEMGIAPGPVFEEVHRANMAKRRGELSKRPNSLGYDAVKPEGWTPPDLEPFLSVRRDDLVDLLARKGHLLQSMLPHGDDVFHSMEGGGVTIWPELPLIEFEVGGPSRPNVLVIGHARHGKDTVCEMLSRLYGLRFTSSSAFCADRVVMPAVTALWDEYEDEQRGRNSQPPTVPRYATVAECFADRVNHRAFWYNTIRAFNQDDPTSLARAIFKENDVYCGLRHRSEFHAVVNAGLPDVVVWVDRSDHLPPEDRSSCSVEPWMADYVVDNNGSLEDLERNVRSLFDRLMEGLA